MIIGIDPGVSGAIVILDNGYPIDWALMPTHQVGNHKRVDPVKLLTFLDIDVPIENIYIEQVGAMPGQGVTSMFSFGHSVGTVVGVVASLCHEPIFVTPQKWKKSADLIGKGKDSSRILCKKMWPECKIFDLKIKGQAFADAALIAYFGGKK